ncbi:MAG TPA: YceI family protein [Pyrinomonadaceae bacterium]|nr:YceI family protein [Pyrinomonadaceae bacterium]
MKIVRNTFPAVLLSAFIALSFIGGTTTPVAGAREKVRDVKVNYVAIPGGDYILDPNHSTIGFDIRHLEINWVGGRFKDFTGKVNYNEQDATKSTVEFTAKVESIDTGVAGRDKHLRTADFFDVATYPEIKFVSTRVEKKGKDKYILHGDFTMKGVTKQISFPFNMTGAIVDGRGNTRFGIEARTRINRRDYNITYGNALPAGGFDLGNEVTINLNLEALKPAPKKAAE